MKNPDPESYLDLIARAMPDPAATALHLRATITLVQTARESLKDASPGNALRAEAALRMVLGGLKVIAEEYDSASQWLATIHPAEGAQRIM